MEKTAKIEKREPEPRFKEEWFKAFYKGVSLVPQTGEGIRLSLAIATIVDNPDTNWEEFAEAELSKAQVNFLITQMHAQHRNKDIVPYLTQESEEEVAQRIRGLVSVYKASTLQMLSRYIFATNINEKVGFTATVVNNFIKNPDNKDKVAELRKILAIIKDVLDSPEMKKILDAYRAGMRGGGLNHWYLNYRPKFIESIENKVREEFQGKLPPNLNYILAEDLEKIDAN